MSGAFVPDILADHMQILLMRHAETDRPGAAADHDRPLTRRGVDDAVAVGAHLARLGLLPARIVSSTAVRAAETARLVAAAGTPPSPTEHEPLLYGAGVDGLLEVARARRADTVMVVGHEPTLSMAVERLCGAAVAMVTAAVVCVDVDETAPPGRAGGVLLWMLTPSLIGGPRS